MQNPYYTKGLSQSLYNSAFAPGRSSYYDDYAKYPAKDPQYLRDRAYYGDRTYAADDYYANSYNKPQGKVWSDYIPIEKRYLDYVPQQKVEYMPVERNYTDYLEVEHQLDYVPVPKLNRRVEYIPVEKYDQSVDYYPYEKSYVKGMGGEAPRVNPPLQQGYSAGTQGYYGGASGYYGGTSGYHGGPTGYYGGGAYVPPQTTYVPPPQSQGYAGGYRNNGYGFAPPPRQPTQNYARDGYWQNKYY